ncbi:MAG: TRAP transporter fused permease subunit [Rhodospirillales bacterium]|nr:TRAP transporter fused permease subunit [Rhodospirillales bacterium]
MPEELPYRVPTGALGGLCILAVAAACLVVLNQKLNLGFFIGKTLIDTRYLYLLATLLLPIVFLAYPAHAAAPMRRVPWYDLAMAATAVAVGTGFIWTAEAALTQGWEYSAPKAAIAASAVLSLLILEALRRTGGTVLTAIVLVFALYPAVASIMPGPIRGLAQPLPDAIAYHIISSESAFGIPMRAFGEIVVGFIVFGVALNYTGGGKFFNDVAFALVGRYRGGAAQVGVISSALQGSISGSVISNVISSGVVTIPAMKRTGFASDYAGGVEAVASTGAVLMPPVMGSTAFVMASFLGKPYAEIAMAAAIPGLLFYFGLMVQIDAYAARRRLSGMLAAELPRFAEVLREGWLYIAVFAVLIYFMLSEQQEAMAPFYATGLLLVINQILPRHRLTRAGFVAMLQALGRELASLVAVLTGVGFIVGAFSMTGLSGTLANDLVYLAGDKPIVLLFMGAVASFIFGMGMTVTACYIFLAIVLAPPLVKAGMDPLAIHLFILYWGMISFITPPVALAAFAAAPIAKTGHFRIGWQAMKLGTIIYIVPFVFALNPALVLRGTWDAIAIALGSAFAGVFLVASAIQGYIAGAGIMPATPAGWCGRLLILAGGIALLLPGGEALGRLGLDLLGAAAAAAGFAVLRLLPPRPAVV